MENKMILLCGRQELALHGFRDYAIYRSEKNKYIKENFGNYYSKEQRMMSICKLL